MTQRMVIIILCVVLIIVIAIGLAIAFVAWDLVRRNERLEAQNEYKTEIIIARNNQLDEAERNYNELEDDYKTLMRERKKENDRGK